MSEIAYQDPDHVRRLTEFRTQMPHHREARIRWYRRPRDDGAADQRALRHAFFGVDDGWDEYDLAPPHPQYLRNIEPGWMWVRIDRNSRTNYVTSGYALNLADSGGEIGPADWHPGCWQVPLAGVHPRARDCIAARYAPLRGKGHYQETWAAIGDWGIVDARGPLRKLNHPAGDRGRRVWAANHPRAIVDRAWNSLRSSTVPVRLQVTPYLVARWLWTDEQFDELLAMADTIGSRSPRDFAAHWREWIACLSPDAAYKDPPDKPKAIGTASHAPAS